MLTVSVLAPPLMSVTLVAWLLAGDGSEGVIRTVTVLVIACPCALVISIPVTVVSGLTRLANLGVLVKGGHVLEKLGRNHSRPGQHTMLHPLGRPPTRLYRAPGRVNLIGEHTDYNERFVLPTGIGDYVEVAVRRRGDTVIRLFAMDLDQELAFGLGYVLATVLGYRFGL